MFCSKNLHTKNILNIFLHFYFSVKLCSSVVISPLTKKPQNLVHLVSEKMGHISKNIDFQKNALKF